MHGISRSPARVSSLVVTHLEAKAISSLDVRAVFLCVSLPSVSSAAELESRAAVFPRPVSPALASLHGSGEMCVNVGLEDYSTCAAAVTFSLHVSEGEPRQLVQVCISAGTRSTRTPHGVVKARSTLTRCLQDVRCFCCEASTTICLHRVLFPTVSRVGGRKNGAGAA